MCRKKAIFLYLLGSLGQIWIVSMIVFILRNLGMIVDYTTPIGMLAIGLGGVSSALWGTIIAVSYKKYSGKRILKDFFAIKQKTSSYLWVLAFLFLDFCYLVFDGKLVLNACIFRLSYFLKQSFSVGLRK